MRRDDATPSPRGLRSRSRTWVYTSGSTPLWMQETTSESETMNLMNSENVDDEKMNLGALSLWVKAEARTSSWSEDEKTVQEKETVCDAGKKSGH